MTQTIAAVILALTAASAPIVFSFRVRADLVRSRAEVELRLFGAVRVFSRSLRLTGTFPFCKLTVVAGRRERRYSLVPLALGTAGKLAGAGYVPLPVLESLRVCAAAGSDDDAMFTALAAGAMNAAAGAARLLAAGARTDCEVSARFGATEGSAAAGGIITVSVADIAAGFIVRIIKGIGGKR